LESLPSVAEAAKRLGGISKWAVHGWVSQGKLQSTKVGRRTMIRESELKKVIRLKYSLEIKPSAQKELDALADHLFTRIDRRILALADNPRPAGCKKLKGYKDQWRIRVGDWRVVYIISDAPKVVSVTRIAHRREVYES